MNPVLRVLLLAIIAVRVLAAVFAIGEPRKPVTKYDAAGTALVGLALVLWVALA